MASTHKAEFSSGSSRYLTNAALTGGIAGITTGGFTVEMWLNAPNTATRQIPFYLGNSTATDSKRITIIMHESLEEILIENVWATSSLLARSNVSLVGATHHVAFTMYPDGANVNIDLYIDGQLVDSAVRTSSTYDYTGVLDTLNIGAALNTTTKAPQEYSDGTIDEVRVWDVVRTQQEICLNADSDYTGIVPASLIGYWKLDNNETDLSADANNLTNTNGVTYSATGLESALTCSTAANKVIFFGSNA